MQYIKWVVVGGTLAAAIVGAIVLTGTASAQGMPQGGHMGYGQMGHAPGIAGVVSAINGTTLTVTSKGFGAFGRGPNATSTASAATTVYSVDASSASLTVMKNGTSSTLSAVSVGDTVFVQGTVSGTNVAATSIRDGVVPGMMPGGFGPGPKRGPWNGTSTASHPMPQNLIQGNGQPVVGGSVTAINGSMLTVVTAANSVTYTIDASNATIEKGNATSTVSSISVGDNVLVQGSVSGTSVTATSVIDQGMPRTATSTPGNGSGGSKGFGGGFFGAIGGIFHRIFGFF